MIDNKQKKMSQNKLDSFAKLHAFEFLNENEEAIKNHTISIRKFIKDHPILDDEEISDEIILYFLRASKFQLEKTQNKIKR